MASLPFLMNYVNPATKSISEYYKSTRPLSALLSRCHSETPEGGSASVDEWLSGLTRAFESPFLVGNSEEQWWDEIIHGPSPLFHSQSAEQDHGRAIITQVTREMAALQRSQFSKESRDRLFDQGIFSSLFTPDNITEATELYFSCWSPHCPILHRPTFAWTTTYPPLLLAVFLIGQAYSSEFDASKAQAFNDLAEEYAFNHPSFRELLQDESCLLAPPPVSLEPLQAAYLMVLVQMCGNSILARRRVRSTRYNDVIRVASRLKLFESKNEYLDSGQRESVDFDWSGFVAQESRIRYVVSSMLLTPFLNLST